MSSCYLCGCHFKNIHNYNTHQEVHNRDENLIIVSAYPGCAKEYTVYSSFRQHIYTHHRENSVKVGSYSCSQNECSFRTRDLKLLKGHLYRHFDQPHKGVFCALPNCSIPNKKFHTANALQIHIYRCSF